MEFMGFNLNLKNMSNFKIGEKVVCVDDSEGNSSGIKSLKKGEIYTIKSIRKITGALSFNEVEAPIDSSGFYSSYRFRKLDHAHTERICAEIIESLKVEELQYN